MVAVHLYLYVNVCVVALIIFLFLTSFVSCVGIYLILIVCGCEITSV